MDAVVATLGHGYHYADAAVTAAGSSLVYMFVQSWLGNGTVASAPSTTYGGGGGNSAFYVHGLWPNYVNGSWPQFCNASEPFSLDAVKTIEPQLLQHWRWSLDDSRNTTAAFWAHEWDKHGTCAGAANDALGSEFDYFDTTLALRRKYAYYDMLARIGVEPAPAPTTTQTPWSYADVVARWVDAYAFKPILTCVKRSLVDIRSCLDTRSLKPINCSDAIYASAEPSDCDPAFSYQ